jgi:hypothetical protein
MPSPRAVVCAMRRTRCIACAAGLAVRLARLRPGCPCPAASSRLTLVIVATRCLPASLAPLADASELLGFGHFGSSTSRQAPMPRPSAHVLALPPPTGAAHLIRSSSLACFFPVCACTKPPFPPLPDHLARASHCKPSRQCVEKEASKLFHPPSSTADQWQPPIWRFSHRRPWASPRSENWE